jgi:hypothetical protein
MTFSGLAVIKLFLKMQKKINRNSLLKKLQFKEIMSTQFCKNEAIEIVVKGLIVLKNII